jgi:hypothetical protein
MQPAVVRAWPRLEGMYIASQDAIKRGKPTFRHRAEIVNALAEERCPEAAKDCGWYSELLDPHTDVGADWLRVWSDDVAAAPGSLLYLPQDEMDIELQDRCRTDSVLAWCSARWREYGKCWFRLEDALVHALMPLPAIYVEFPRGVLSLYHRLTGWHDTRALYVCEGYYNSPYLDLCGRRLLIVADTEPNANSSDVLDNNFVHWTVPLSDPHKSVETLCSQLDAKHNELAGTIYESYVEATSAKILGSVVPKRAGMELLQRFVLNMLLFLTSDQAATERVQLKSTKKGRRAARHGGLPPHNLTLVRSNVKIAPGIREAYRSGRATDRKITVRTVVRGHYRRQACGPRHSERKLIWIAPHIRGKDVATALRGHEYSVAKEET